MSCKKNRRMHPHKAKSLQGRCRENTTRCSLETYQIIHLSVTVLPLMKFWWANGTYLKPPWTFPPFIQYLLWSYLSFICIFNIFLFIATNIKWLYSFIKGFIKFGDVTKNTSYVILTTLSVLNWLNWQCYGHWENACISLLGC